MNALRLIQYATDVSSESDAVKTAFNAWHSAKGQLSSVEDTIKEHCSTPGILGEAAQYHMSTGGKRFRPMFLLAVSSAVGADRRSALQLAVAVEMLHNASLVHDDLQDRDEFRRGKNTVWRRYGADMAINLGDFFISSAYSALSRTGCNAERLAEVVALFADSTKKIIAGQSEEIRLTRQVSTEPEAYFRIARGKSGVLMALPVVGALMIAGVDSRTIGSARRAMENLGVAYQIQDDLSDILGSKDGRAPGVDLREGRMSLPIIQYLATADDADRRFLEKMIVSGPPSDPVEMAACLEKLRNSGVVGFCREQIDLTIRNSLGHTEPLPPVLRETLKLGMRTVTSAFRKKSAATGEKSGE